MRVSIALGAAAAGCAFLFPGVAAASPAVAVSPAQVSFGQGCIGAPSAPSAVTVTNSGDQTLEVSGISVSGTNAADFAIAGGERRSVAPGGSFQFRVTFTPAAGGARQASAIITSNAPSSPTSVPLSGEGVTRVLEINPNGLVFGDQRVGTSSDDLSISLASTGTARVTIKKVTLEGDQRTDFTLRAPAQTELDPGEDGTISVVFRPRAARARSAAIVIESDACSGRTRVALSGTGTAPDIRVSPSALDVGRVDIGRHAEAVPVVVSNVGRAPLRLTKIEIGGSGATDFRFEGIPPLPRVLGPGDEFLLNVTFTPSLDGPREAVLRIESDDPDTPALQVLVGGNRLVSASPSTTIQEEQPTGNPTPRLQGGKSAIRAAASGGAGDWLAIGVVTALVTGIFAGLFAVARRRAPEL